MVVDVVQQNKPGRNIQQAKAHYHKAHDGPATKRDDKPSVQTAHGALCRSGTGVGRRLHSQKTAQAAEETAGEERYRYKGILDTHEGEHHEHGEQHRENDGDGLVLAPQVGECPYPHKVGDGFHFMVAVGGLFHGPVEQVGHSESKEGGNGNKEPKTGNRSHGNLLLEIYLQKAKKAQMFCLFATKN